MQFIRISLGLIGLALVAGCSGDEEEAFAIFPPVVFTGFDEAGGYTAPVAVEGGSGVVWTSSNDAVVSVSGTDTTGTLTGKTAGTAKISVVSGGETMMVDVTVAMYTSADKTAGQTVYTDFDCGECHGPTAESDITPSGVSEHTDAQLVAAIVMGTEPEGGEIESPDHLYALSADQQRQILAYLRGKAPQGTPKED